MNRVISDSSHHLKTRVSDSISKNCPNESFVTSHDSWLVSSLLGEMLDKIRRKWRKDKLILLEKEDICDKWVYDETIQYYITSDQEHSGILDFWE